MNKHCSPHNHQKSFMIGRLAITTLLLITISIGLKTYRTLTIELIHAQQPSEAQGVNFSLQVDQAQYTLDQEIPVKVMVRADTDTVNLLSAQLRFAPAFLEVARIETTGSFITFWPDNFFDNTVGAISLIGTVPTPGFQTNQTPALMATVVFRAKSNGSTILGFDNTSQILRNLDNMNILGSTQGLTLSIIPPPTPTAIPTLAPTPTPTPSPCLLERAYWVGPNFKIKEKSLARLEVVTVGDCTGKAVTFKIWNDRGILPERPVKNDPPAAKIIDGKANTTWRAEFISGGILDIFSGPKYYFQASVVDEPTAPTNVKQAASITSSGPLLEVAAAPDAPDPNDWPQLGHDPQHTGWSPVTVNPPFTSTPFMWRWLDGYGKVNGVLNPVPAGYPFSGMAQPIVAEGKVFIGSITGHVNAVDANTGETAWRVQPSSQPILHTMAYDNGVVFAASTDHKVYALRAFDGQPLWNYETGGSLSGAVVIYYSGSEAYIIVGSSDKYLYALRPDGTLRWRAKLDGPIISTPAVGNVDGTTKIFVGAEDMYAYAFDLNGNRLWKSPQKLYGASFRNFWPVVSERYNLVFFTTQHPFLNAEHTLWPQVDGFLDCLRSRSIGGDAEMAAILNGNANCTQYPGLNNDNYRKTVFALRTSNGTQPFQLPITYFGSNNNTHVPPVIDQNGDIYTYYHVWDQTVYIGQSYGSKYSPDLARMNPTNGYRIPINVTNKISTISIQADNVHTLSMGGSTIIPLHLFFYAHYVNVNKSQPANQNDADLFWFVTDRNGWIPRFSWYQSEGNNIDGFPPAIRGEFVGDSGAAIGPSNRIYINASGGMLTAIQASP